jgi:hypothetical protein
MYFNIKNTLKSNRNHNQGDGACNHVSNNCRVKCDLVIGTIAFEVNHRNRKINACIRSRNNLESRMSLDN